MLLPKFFSPLIILFIFLSNSYHANAYEIRHNCNLRTLKLDNTQKKQLRSLRQQYKKERDLITSYFNRPNRSSVPVRIIFEKDYFDPNLAQHVAYEHHKEKILLATEELRFYHKLFYILTPQQRNIWLNQCVS